MLISHEVPLSLLEKSLEFNDYDYCLPLFYKRYPKYKEFYQRCSNLGRMVILDNGIFEGDILPDDELISLCNELRPSIFIIPDSWNNADESLRNAKYWANVLKTRIPNSTNLMAVIQCTDINVGSGLYQAYIDLGIRHIAFNHSSSAYSKFFPHRNDLVSKMMGRIYFINKLMQLNILNETVYHHLLGASLVQEFMYYKDYPFIKSCDTSNPIIFGLLGKIYESWGMLEKPQQKIEEFMEMDCFKCEGIVIHNVDRFRNFVNGTPKLIEI